MQLLLAAPIILGHQLHGQVKLNAGQQRPGGLPLDTQRAEVVESAALLVIGSQVQHGVSVAGDWNLQEAKIRCHGHTQTTLDTMFTLSEKRTPYWLSHS